MNIWYVIGAIALAVAVASVLMFTSYSVPERPQLPDVYIMQFEPNVPGVDISLEVGSVITVSITNNLEESITAIFYEEMILPTGESSQVTIEGESQIDVLPGQTRQVHITPGGTFSEFYLPLDIVAKGVKYKCKATIGLVQQ
ncbi:hypothetical protein [Mesotoga sp. UBA5847]|jgi:FtsP/CotA-like multicopper oxidase with cupredoxin domain|uniref:hypothetical protein n=1 Tax=Mesotoga sp. UBA5847 TaxID=1946859 RepID=UPI0025E5B3B8|nr:hypothetical protein [Mesotoga sp. UBA5847]